jgi:hypothetical protein
VGSQGFPQLQGSVDCGAGEVRPEEADQPEAEELKLKPLNASLVKFQSISKILEWGIELDQKTSETGSEK